MTDYGKRKDDFNNMLPPIDIPNMTDSQKVLNMLRDGLIAHDTRLQGLRDGLNETDTKVHTLETIVITGDKELPHTERIRKLEGYVGDIRDAFRYWGRLVGGALLLNFLAFLGGIIVAIVKFLPVLERLANHP